MKKKLLMMFVLLALASNIWSQEKPNVVIIYLDDLGFGDLGANGPTGLKVPKDSKYLDTNIKTLTPNLDKLAAQSVRFTNGHSSDGVCSPSRYSLVTGHYSWRTSLKKGVVGGYGSTFMDKDRFTVGTLFKKLGYKTSMVGKWHIGMTFYNENGSPYSSKRRNNTQVLEKNLIDFSHEVKDTPAHRGFDYWYGTPSSLDMPPYAWLESDTITKKVHVLYQGGIVENDQVDFSKARIARNSDFVNFKKNDGVHARGGAKDPTFKHEDYLQIQSQKVRDLIKSYQKNKDSFLMYIPMPAPHEPHAIQPKFEGSAGFKYGDYVVQTDYYVGEIINALGDPKDPTSLAYNTVVFVTSDNGPEVGAYFRGLKYNHDANGPWAGVKRDNYEGGTRVPFMIRWPKLVKPKVTNHLTLQGDIIATMAEYLHYDLKKNEAPDSESFLPVLIGDSLPQKQRLGIVEHSSMGQFAFVENTGEWKLIDGTGGGGNATTADAKNNRILKVGELRGKPRQLFNLLNDPGEYDNLLVDDPNNPNDNNDPTKEALQKEQELYKALNIIRGDKEYGDEMGSR
ncbi:sulfatase-like hydrolase/transferase [Wenyingzhuangia sp. IMCC45533]